MKNITTLFFLIIQSVILSQSDNRCERFKIGSFEIGNMDGTISTIIRTKKFQEEKSPNFTGKDRVKWIDECSFQLIPLEINDKTGQVGSEILTITIIETGEHHYIMKATGLGEGIEIYGKVYEKGYLNYDEK